MIYVKGYSTTIISGNNIRKYLLESDFLAEYPLNIELITLTLAYM